MYRGLERVAEVDTLLLREPTELGLEERNTLESEFGLRDCLLPLSRGERGLWKLIRPLRPRLVVERYD